jgi:hypothetical protein|tara:strand:- start:1861 stop:2208 length:348 start_codon:yes stop_codon:yes gene_type:complete
MEFVNDGNWVTGRQACRGSDNEWVSYISARYDATTGKIIPKLKRKRNMNKFTAEEIEILLDVGFRRAGPTGCVFRTYQEQFQIIEKKGRFLIFTCDTIQVFKNTSVYSVLIIANL